MSNRGQIKKNMCLGIFYLCYPLCFFYDDRVKRKRKWEECLDFCVFARFYPYCFSQQMCLPLGIHARRIRSIRRVTPGITCPSVALRMMGARLLNRRCNQVTLVKRVRRQVILARGEEFVQGQAR